MNQPKLILPEGVQRERGVEKAKPPEKKRIDLPPEMLAEIKGHMEEAKQVGEQIKALVEKGSAAQVALVCQEPVRAFLTLHLRSLLPQIAQTFAYADRTQIHNFFRQIQQQRLSPANLSRERVDKDTYDLAMADFLSLISRVPAQVIPIEVGMPDLDLESQEPETKDTEQGE